MASYLRLEVGPYFLLVPTDEVFEVLAFTPRNDGESFLVWRDEILTAVSMRSRLGLPDNGTGVLIVHGRNGLGREGLLVDKVLGLVELNEGDFRPIPMSSGELDIHFDRVWSDRYRGRQTLRMRSLDHTLRVRSLDHERTASCSAPTLTV